MSTIPPPDDEVVSAHLDGEATPDEVARVAAEPELAARAAVLERAIAAVATPVEPAPGDARERAIAAALDAWVAPGSAAPAGAAPAPVIDLAARRARRQRVLLSAAAAVVVVLIGGGAVVQLTRGGPRQDVTTAAAPSASSTTANLEASRDAVVQAPTAAEGTPGVSATTAPPTTTSATAGAAGPPRSAAPANLGAIANPAQLRDAVVGAFAADSATAPAQPSTTTTTRAGAPTTATGVAPTASVAAQFASCDASVRARDRELGELVFTATATYAGRDALVLVYALTPINANGPVRIFAVDRGTCTILASVTP